MKAEFLPDAEDELLESSRYYESKAPGVGIAFITDIHNAVSTIVALPNAGEPVRENIRRKPLRHFPHDLIYAIENDLIYHPCCCAPQEEAYVLAQQAAQPRQFAQKITLCHPPSQLTSTP